MPDSGGDSLRGLQVAVTGRMASMTRDEAISAITAAGGRYVAAVEPSTDILVVGEDGWPLAHNGHLTRALAHARTLERQGQEIAILAEQAFLERLGLQQQRDDMQRLFTVRQLSRMLEVPLAQVQEWVRSRLIRPVKTLRRLHFFDFRQVASARTLQRLTQDGATTVRIRRSLQQLQRWLPETAEPLSQLETLERGDVVVRLDGGGLADPSGQRHLDFSAHADANRDASPLRHQPCRDAAEWFEDGIRAESDGRLEDAAHAYHHALLAGGAEAEIAFNFANVLYADGHVGEAAQRFMQAVEIDPHYAEAWNNLGNALFELHRDTGAIDAYQRALALDPSYSDAHFNLATTYDQLKKPIAARRHWQAFIAQAPRSPSADEARRRLAETGHSAGAVSSAETDEPAPDGAAMTEQ